MSLGAILTLILFIFLFLFLAFDFIIWKLGKETMSQWIIKRKKESSIVRYGLILFLVLTCAILLWHWELI